MYDVNIWLCRCWANNRNNFTFTKWQFDRTQYKFKTWLKWIQIIKEPMKTLIAITIQTRVRVFDIKGFNCCAGTIRTWKLWSNWPLFTCKLAFLKYFVTYPKCLLWLLLVVYSKASIWTQSLLFATFLSIYSGQIQVVTNVLDKHHQF